MDAEFDRLLTLCEVGYYNHLRAMSLLEEGKVSEHFVSACEAGRRMTRENLRDYMRRVYCVAPAREPSGETMAQREEVCEAWAAMPAALTAHPAMKRLYRALGGILPHGVPEVVAPSIQKLLDRFERAAMRKGELWERCQGKGWPDAESDEFTKLRDERIPALRAEICATHGVEGTPK
jgi:hypothetical protein